MRLLGRRKLRNYGDGRSRVFVENNVVKLMATTKRLSVLEGLRSEIIASIGKTGPHESADFPVPNEEIQSLLQDDYGRTLRQSFGRCEIHGIIAEARRRVWPQLNREPVKIGSAQEFTSRWSHLGVDFRLARMSSPQGLALMGFYVRKAPGSGRPLIYVNTAHHRVAVATSFSHEMGHHVTAEIFDSSREPGRYLLSTAYAEHLKDPVELAADILVSLGVFPAQIARTLFGHDKGKRTKHEEQEAQAPFGKVLNYFDSRYHLNFKAHFQAEKKLQYLAGLIHYAELRRALLDEYDL